MNIIINGTKTEVAGGSTVYDIAQANGAGQTGAAVAVNNKLVRRADWQQTPLAEGDDVVIIKAAYGG